MTDMNDSNNSGDKTLSVPPSKTLSLKRPVEQGVVRQSFSHGRSKAVVVEKVKHRIVGRADGTHREGGPSAVAAPTKPAPAAPSVARPTPAAPAAAVAPAVS